MGRTRSEFADNPETIEVRVGLVVKRLRESASLSLRAFAERVDFSASFISQLENGQVSPSIASLERIATALNITLADFFAAPTQRDTAVIRANARPSFRSSWSQARVSALTSMGRGRPLEALMVTLDPGGESGKHAAPSLHDQFAIVFAGTVEVTLGRESMTLFAGDAIHIAAGVRHRWQNRHRRFAQFVLVSARRN